MENIYDILNRIYKDLALTLAGCGFVPVIPEGTEKGALPAKTEGDKITIAFKGENKALKIEHFDKRLTVSGVLKEGEISEGDFAVISNSILDPEDINDKQIKYFVNEISESVTERFSPAAEKKIKMQRAPQTVSWDKVENGGMSYDEVTLVSRIAGIYPHLKPAYKENYEGYGELLADKFFRESANPVIFETIKANRPAEMKKLFSILNDLYLDGTNNTQSIITVTILGQLGDELLANCTDYMTPELLTPVVQVNKYLSKSKSAQMRLENPPAYKPKKNKKTPGSRIG